MDGGFDLNGRDLEIWVDVGGDEGELVDFVAEFGWQGQKGGCGLLLFRGDVLWVFEVGFLVGTLAAGSWRVGYVRCTESCGFIASILFPGLFLRPIVDRYNWVAFYPELEARLKVGEGGRRALRKLEVKKEG